MSDLFHLPTTSGGWDRFRLTDDQIAFFHEHGYLAGVRILDERQVERLRDELDALFDPRHPGHRLFYEYNSNESTVPGTVLFHALGAWRITAGFHDVLWNPAFTVPASQLLGGRGALLARSALLQAARSMAGSSPGIRTTHTGRAPKPMAHLTCWIGLDESTRKTAACTTSPAATAGTCCPITGLAGDMVAIQTVLSEEQNARTRSPIELKAGKRRSTIR